MVGAVTDDKGITHLYLYNSRVQPTTIARKTVVGTVDETRTFHFNMLGDEGDMAAIFGREMETLRMGLPSRNWAR
jgi:hypothetical protein